MAALRANQPTTGIITLRLVTADNITQREDDEANRANTSTQQSNEGCDEGCDDKSNDTRKHTNRSKEYQDHKSGEMSRT